MATRIHDCPVIYEAAILECYSIVAGFYKKYHRTIRGRRAVFFEDDDVVVVVVVVVLKRVQQFYRPHPSA
jgi:hypothetical protein